MSLSPAQVAQLLKPVNPSRVQVLDGQSHLAAYDVTAHLTRIFGFGGWDKTILDLSLVAEAEVPRDQGRKPLWVVTYRCQMRLVIRDPEGAVVTIIEDASCGTGNLPQRGESHDMAVKSAVSYALKRCAKDLGDQFGLSLYNRGNLGPLVGRTLVEDAETPDAHLSPLAPDVEVPA